MRKYRTLPLLLIVCGALLATGAPARARPPGTSRAATDPDVAQPPADTYLFVELWVEVRGTGTLPPLIVDYPGYSFNPAAGTLRPGFNKVPPLHPSAWGFAGAGTSRSGAAGAGVASNLLTVPTLPFSTTIAIGTGATVGNYEQTRAATVELQGISAEGVLRATIDGAPELLQPGSSWVKRVSASLKTAEYDGRYEVISSVTNYGWQVRELVAGPTHFIWLPRAAK